MRAHFLGAMPGATGACSAAAAAAARTAACALAAIRPAAAHGRCGLGHVLHDDLDIGFTREGGGQRPAIAVARTEMKDRCLRAIERHFGIEYLDGQSHLASKSPGVRNQAD